MANVQVISTANTNVVDRDGNLVVSLATYGQFDPKDQTANRNGQACDRRVGQFDRG